MSLIRKSKSWHDFAPENIVSQNRNPFNEPDVKMWYRKRSVSLNNKAEEKNTQKHDERFFVDCTKIALSSALFVTSPNHQNSSP